MGGAHAPLATDRGIDSGTDEDTGGKGRRAIDRRKSLTALDISSHAGAHSRSSRGRSNSESRTGFGGPLLPHLWSPLLFFAFVHLKASRKEERAHFADLLREVRAIAAEEGRPHFDVFAWASIFSGLHPGLGMRFTSDSSRESVHERPWRAEAQNRPRRLRTEPTTCSPTSDSRTPTGVGPGCASRTL